MASSNCQFDTIELPGKRVSLKDCPPWVGLWVCLWEITLIESISVRTVGGTIPSTAALECVRVEEPS